MASFPTYTIGFRVWGVKIWKVNHPAENDVLYI